MGAIKNWVSLQDEYDCLYCIVDMHAITVRQNPADLRRRSVDQLAQYIACGLDPAKNIMFIQSHVPQHAELSWVLGCYTQFGELSRMTQFKDKAAKHADNITAGLFTYPVLMAADILALSGRPRAGRSGSEAARRALPRHRAALQRRVRRHLHAARAVYPEDGRARDEPRRPDEQDVQVRPRRLRLHDGQARGHHAQVQARGDGLRRPACSYDKENKPGISNLLSIYCAATGKTVAEAEAEFAGQGYGIFKPAVAESVIELLRPIREEAERLTADKAYLESVYKDGAQKASYLAEKTLRKVYKKVGFVAR